MNDHDHPLARNFLALQRKTARGYTCPLCEHTYHQEPKIWNHGVRKHSQYLKSLGSVEKAEGVRRRFRQEALDKAQQKAIDTGKASSGAAEVVPPLEPQSRSNKNNGRNIGGQDAEPDSAARPFSVPGHSQGSEKKIDDIRDLSLEHEDLSRQNNTITFINNPRKRGPEPQSGSPGPPTGGYNARPMSARARHGKTLSGSRNADYTRQSAPLDETDYRRGPPGPKQPLFDPDNDPTNNGKGFRREKQYGHLNTVHWKHPSKGFGSSQQELYLAQKDLAYQQVHDGHEKPYVHQALDQAVSQRKQPPLSEKGQENESSESHSGDDPVGENNSENQDTQPEMLLQPETRPISHEQLVVEVKGIYAGLVMVEAKCIDIDERQSAAAQERDPSKRPELKNDQWQSLIALHKQLLHEHHDFFLASQHPSASIPLSRLAAKYSMPARMWRHGIHAFLEVLRHRLPESLEHMLAFVYIAYSMMALLYETVPAFEDTWIECLGDLGRYRMAIEDDEPKDREVWSNVAKFWYNKASDKTPKVGRLYHHLAILARPYTLEQLSLYTRALTCVIPFESAKGSIMTLFNPILHNKETSQRRPYSLETLFIVAHALFFTSKASDSPDKINANIDELEGDGLFEKYISKAAARFKETGVHIAISNIAALFEYGISKDGRPKSRLRIAFESAHVIHEKAFTSPAANRIDANLPPSTGPPNTDINNPVAFGSNESESFISQISRLASFVLGICLKYPRDSNVLPLVHVYLVFYWSLTIVQGFNGDFEQDTVLKTIENDIPRESLCSFLNTLAEDPEALTSNVWNKKFPRPSREAGRPLPEDYVMRGQIYTQWYFPVNEKGEDDWFTSAKVDEDERSHDLPSMAQPRKERMLWLGYRISSANRWIRFDKEKQSFLTTDFANEDIISKIKPTAGSHEDEIIML